MSQTTEKAFESHLEQMLAEGGWRSGSLAEWDKARALFPARVFAFIEATQPKLWTNVLELYAQNQLTVTRQVPCHPGDHSTTDIVRAINGLPVATIELKTPGTHQTWRHAAGGAALKINPTRGMRCVARSRWLAPVIVIALALPSAVWAGAVESFNSRLFDLLYFARPVERIAVAGGTWAGQGDTAAAVLLNPATLARLDEPATLAYGTVNALKGETYGLKQLIPPGPGHPAPERIHERPRVQISSLGFQRIARPRFVPGAISLGVDTLWDDTTDNAISRIVAHGIRASLAYGTDLSDRLSLGYELVYSEDDWQWDVTWTSFVPGQPMPRNVDYLLRSAATGWRHRLGLLGTAGHALRYGLTAELGHGDTDNTWNGVATSGGDATRHHGARVSLEHDPTPRLTLAAAMAWQDTRIEFGRHPAAIGGHGAVARWKTEVFRPMLGFRYRLTETWQLLGGYRYTLFNTLDMCGQDADHQYHSFSAGAMLAVRPRVRLLGNIDYSNIEPAGEWAGLLAVQMAF